MEKAASVVLAVEAFKASYLEQLVRGLKAVPQTAVEAAAYLIQTAVKNRATIYIFGNGGSYAIARHFEAALREGFKNSSFGVRTNCGIDPYVLQTATHNGYVNIFADVLKTEGANPKDAVLFISGSGDSGNLIRAARYAGRLGVPIVSFSGFDGGKISKETDLAIVVPICDQQIVEDAIQSLLRIVAGKAAALARRKPVPAGKTLKALYKGLESAQPRFLLSLSKAIYKAFSSGRSVYVLAPEGAGMAISAEHTAHNFNWDLVYKIPDPPRRCVYSSPTYCDFSGIGNDRLVPGVVTVQQLDKAQRKDLLLLFAHDPKAPSVLNVLRKAKRQHMEIFLISGKVLTIPPGVKGISLCSPNAGTSADIMQMLGHITARITRQRFKQPRVITKNNLIREDMAQRRLLSERVRK